MNQEKNSKIKANLKNIWELVRYALVAIIIVIPIRMFIAQPFVVSGESMFPTFHDGEYLIVDELSYNIGEPKRGDVIVFRYPKEPKRFFIKRIIGLPNEEISINGNEIKIFNKENPEGFKLEESYIKEKSSFVGSYKTGEKEYFVMGDNRNNSSDSRSWGLLPEKLITGRAYLRLLPFKDISYLPGHLEKFNLGINNYESR